MRRILLLALLCVILLSSFSRSSALAAGANSAARPIFVPAIPFILDGVRYSQSESYRLGGQPLHFVLAKAQTQPELYAFRTDQEAAQFMARQVGTATTASSCPGYDYSARAYIWPSFNRGWLDISGDLPDLSHVQRGFWPWDNWDNQISSIKVACYSSVTLYVSANFSGSSLALPQNTNLAGLASDFDNQISSIRYHTWDPICETRQGQNGQSETWCEVYDDYGNYLGWRRVA